MARSAASFIFWVSVAGSVSGGFGVTAEGRIVKGQTNAQGMTQSVATLKPDLAVVRWTV